MFKEFFKCVKKNNTIDFNWDLKGQNLPRAQAYLSPVTRVSRSCAKNEAPEEVAGLK